MQNFAGNGARPNMMSFVPKDADDLRSALERLQGDMPVELGPGIDLTTSTVDDLRKLSDLPPNLLFSIPVKSQVNRVTVQKLSK